jgi:hypothetical protein
MLSKIYTLAIICAATFPALSNTKANSLLFKNQFFIVYKTVSKVTNNITYIRLNAIFNTIILKPQLTLYIAVAAKDSPNQLLEYDNQLSKILKKEQRLAQLSKLSSS